MIECFMNNRKLYKSFIRYFDMESIDVSHGERLLAKQEKEELLQKKTEKSIFRSKIGFICTKMALKEFFSLNPNELRQVVLLKGVFGQPILTSDFSLTSTLGISLSYTRSTIGILLFDQRHPMGLDIEEKTVEDAPFLVDFLTVDELELIQMNKEVLTKEMFFSAKESLSKILKTGLTSPLFIYEISDFKITDASTFLYFKNFTQYHTEVTVYRNEYRSITYPINSQKTLKECII